MADIAVKENPDEERFEIAVDGELAGFTVYQERGNNYALLHTEIDDRYAGQGLGSILIRHTLDDLRSRGIGVLPYCPFVRAFLAKNRDYADLAKPI
jgi:predicted GNAT family acetyltransferase